MPKARVRPVQPALSFFPLAKESDGARDQKGSLTKEEVTLVKEKVPLRPSLKRVKQLGRDRKDI